MHVGLQYDTGNPPPGFHTSATIAGGHSPLYLFIIVRSRERHAVRADVQHARAQRRVQSAQSRCMQLHDMELPIHRGMECMCILQYETACMIVTCMQCMTLHSLRNSRLPVRRVLGLPHRRQPDALAAQRTGFARRPMTLSYVGTNTNVHGLLSLAVTSHTR